MGFKTGNHISSNGSISLIYDKADLEEKITALNKKINAYNCGTVAAVVFAALGITLSVVLSNPIPIVVCGGLALYLLYSRRQALKTIADDEAHNLFFYREETVLANDNKQYRGEGTDGILHRFLAIRRARLVEVSE